MKKIVTVLQKHISLETAAVLSLLVLFLFPLRNPDTLRTVLDLMLIGGALEAVNH